MSKGRNLGLAARFVGVINVHSSSAPHWGANNEGMIALWRGLVKLEFGQDNVLGAVNNRKKRCSFRGRLRGGPLQRYARRYGTGAVPYDLVYFKLVYFKGVDDGLLFGAGDVARGVA
jgi:hypothetical protein